MPKTKVLIADPQTLTREGLKALFSRRPDLEVVGDVSHARNLANGIRENGPDLLVIDYDVPGAFGISDLISIRTTYPQLGIMVVTSNQKKEDILQVLELKVPVYLLKECDEGELLNAISACIKGEKFFCGRIMDTILESATRSVSPAEPDECLPVQLTDREMEVIRLIGNGNTTKAIADQLFLSFHTVTTHRRNIFKKLSVRTASELVVYAVQNGIIVRNDGDGLA